MPRYVLALNFGYMLSDENANVVDAGCIVGTVAIDSKSQSVDEIIDAVTMEYGDDVAKYAKELFTKANEKK